MRQGVPTITAPLSRKKRNNGMISTPIGMICAVLSAIFAFGGTIILAMAMISSSTSKNNNNNGNVDGNGNARGKPASLRQAAAVINSSPTKSDVSNNAQGLIVRTSLGDIRIHFTPELAGEGSIKYIKDVVQAASSKQNNRMGYTTAETMNGRRITEGFMCQKCK